MKQGEGETLDFKQKISSQEKIARTLCAFANTRGGILLVGVTDQRGLTGIDPEEEKFMLEEAALHYCKPAIALLFEEIEEEENDQEITILKVTVEESLQKPHACMNKAGQWQVYMRQGDKSLPAGKNMIRLLATDKVAARPAEGEVLDKNEHKIMQHLQLHERITVKELALLINFSKRRAQRLLNQMVGKGLIRLFEHEHDDYYA